MGNRPHPHRRQDRIAFMTDKEFEAECDRAYLQGVAMEEEERAARIREYENSPEQADWDRDEDAENEYWEAKAYQMYGDSAWDDPR